MLIGIGIPIPDLANLPGSSRPGGGSAFEYTPIDNNFSMEFDGAQSYFQGSDISSLDNASAFSISFWFKPNVLNVSHRIMSKYLDSNNRTTLSLFTTSFSINISRGGLKTGTTTYPTQNPIPWKHIGIIFDGTKSTNEEKLICLFDGLPQTLTFSQGALPSQTANTAGKTFNIGALDTGSSILNPVNGKLDEVAVWGGTALSEDTMKAIYDTTANNPGKVADLSETPEGAPTAWYRMGD